VTTIHGSGLASAFAEAGEYPAPATIHGSASASAFASAVLTGPISGVIGVTDNGTAGRSRGGYAVASWTPPVVPPPSVTAVPQAFDVAQAFSTPTFVGPNATQPSYAVTTATEKRHRSRIVIGGVDVSYFRGVVTPEPDYQLVEPLLYSTATIDLPQVRPAFEHLGVGALSWCRKGASVLIQRVDIDTGLVVTTDYRGLVIDLDISGDSLVIGCGGEAAGRLAMIQKQLEIRDYTKDIGWFAAYWLRNWNLPFLPALGPTTGITLGTSGGVSALDYISELCTQARLIGGTQYTIMPGIGAAAGTDSYGMAPKDTTTIHGTVYLDDTRCVGALRSDLAEEPNRIYATAVGPDARRIRGAVYPGLIQGQAPAWPGGTLSEGATGNTVVALNSRLIVTGFLNAADVHDNNIWSPATTAAVQQFRRHVGASAGSTMTSGLWDILWDNTRTSWSMTNAHIEPMAQLDAVRPYNLTGSGALAGRNASYDPSVPPVDRNIDMGKGFTETTVRGWSQAALDAASQPNWVGTITITQGAIPAGNHTPGDPISSLLRARDIKPGMNLRLPLFAGGITVHVSGVTVTGAKDGDLGSVQLIVDTRARDALEVWQIVQRNRASRKSPARRWLDANLASAQTKDVVNEWDDVGGKISTVSVPSQTWTVFPVIAGQEGQVTRLHLNTNPNAAFAVAIFGRKITSGQLTRLVGSPMTEAGQAKWSNAAIRKQLDDTFVLLYVAGDSAQPCGYYPGSLASSSPLTGEWRDYAGFPYYGLDGPELFVAIFADRATSLAAGRIMWDQVGP
jgi:hypothetical protein